MTNSSIKAMSLHAKNFKIHQNQQKVHFHLQGKNLALASWLN